tara:strand:+ start:1897 stop:2151 length:255 start_codon:yes stop_codon:yes gene_type:complete
MKNTLENKRYEKKGSRNYMIVGPNTWMNDKDDPDWFIDITTYSKKKNEESKVITVTKNDLEGHMRMHKRDGWKEVPFPEKDEEN